MNLLDQAKQKDHACPLAHTRDAFYIPANTHYFDGNSLGAMPLAAKKRAIEVVETQWGEHLITSWNRHQWIDLPHSVGKKIAPIIGADDDEVIACDATSVNLYKVLHAALSLAPNRHRIISEKGNFPTDLYMLEGLKQTRPELDITLVEKAQLIDSLSDDVAILMLTHVNFRSGYMHDMHAITHAAQQKGILVVWDLAHSAGAVPLNLNDANVDFAVGCGYKYLNGGPGAPAFIFAAKRHHDGISQPLSGWMGHASPFTFDEKYQKASGIRQFLTGTPNVISMSVLDAALDVFENVKMTQVREKSLGLSRFMADAVAKSDALASLTRVTEMDDATRGSQLAFAHPEAYAICQALIAEGFIADFRAPNILRIGFTPLYTRYQDVALLVNALISVMTEKRYLLPEHQAKHTVT